MKKKDAVGSWYLADVVERCEPVGGDKSNPNRRCLTWVNTLLIRAPSLSAAYHKAMKIAKKEYTHRYKAVSGQTIQWSVLGPISRITILGNLAGFRVSSIPSLPPLKSPMGFARAPLSTLEPVRILAIPE